MAGSDALAPPAPPTVRVRLFASLREAAGWSERVIRADTPHITPADLWQQLGLSTPAAPAPRGR